MLNFSNWQWWLTSYLVPRCNIYNFVFPTKTLCTHVCILLLPSHCRGTTTTQHINVNSLPKHQCSKIYQVRDPSKGNHKVIDIWTNNFKERTLHVVYLTSQINLNSLHNQKVAKIPRRFVQEVQVHIGEPIYPSTSHKASLSNPIMTRHKRTYDC